MAMKVMIVEDHGKIRRAEATSLQFVVLPHPKTGNLVFVSIDNDIYELQNYEPRTHASWFIDQRVSSADSIYVATKIDPRFLLIPFIAKTSRYSLIEQIVSHVAGCDRFNLKNIGVWQMADICDVNDKYDDEVFYRHNEETLMAFLTAKIVRCATHLSKVRLARLGASNSKGFASGFNAAAQRAKTTHMEVTTSDSAVVAKGPLYVEEDLRQALQIVGDYLSDEISVRLASHLATIGVLSPLAGVDVDLQEGGEGSKFVPAEEKRKASWETDLEVCACLI